MRFGQFIKSKRQQCHLSQSDVADILGLHPSTVSLLESDNRQWRLEHIQQFAPLVKMAPYQLMFEFHLSENGDNYSLRQTALRWFFSLSQDEIEEKIKELFLAKEGSWKSHKRRK